MSTSSDVTREALYKKIFWRLLPFLVLCYFIAGIDRSNVAFAKFQFQAALGFSEAIYGIGGGIFTLGYLLFEVPSNMWLKRIGIRKTLLRIMCLWGALCVLMAFMQTQWHFYTLRFLIGAAEAGFFPGVLFYLSKWAPPHQRARMMGVFMASIGIAGALSGPIAGAILTYMDGTMGLAGWQWLFIVEGIPAVILGVTAYFYLDETPRAAKWLTPDELDHVEQDLAAGNDASATIETGAKALSVPLISVLLTRQYIGLLFACFALMGGTAAYFMWIPTIFKSIGVDDMMQIGWYSAGPFAVAIVLQYLFAGSSDKHGERYWHIAAGFIVSALCWLIMAVIDLSPMFAVILLTAIVATTTISYGPFWSVPATILPPEHRAIGIATLTTLGGLASLFQPVAAGIIIDMTGDVSKSLYLNAGFIAVCVVVYLVLCDNAGLTKQIEVKSSAE